MSGNANDKNSFAKLYGRDVALGLAQAPAQAPINDGVIRGLLMAAEIVEDSRNVDIELCDMLADRIRQMADKEKARRAETDGLSRLNGC